MCIHAYDIISALNFQQANSFEIPKLRNLSMLYVLVLVVSLSAG